MDIWAWTRDWVRNAYEKEDQARIELFERFREGMDALSTEPVRAAAILAANAEAARNLNESWWALLNEHWRLQALHEFLGDAGQALDLAVRTAVEARKHPALPQRVCIHEDLIGAYIDIDAHGHARLIQNALDYMEREVAPGAECRFCLYGLQRTFALETGDYPAVAGLAFQELAALQNQTKSRDHHAATVMSDLCRVALSVYSSAAGEEDRPDDATIRLRQVENLLDWSRAGEVMARSADRRTLVPALLMWQAVAIRIFVEELYASPEADEEWDAHDVLYKRAHTLSQAQPLKPSDSFYAAWRSYHENFEEWEGALEATEAMLASIENCGRKSREARGHIYRCYVLTNLNRLTRADLDKARAAVNKLADPAEFLESIELFEEWLEAAGE